MRRILLFPTLLLSSLVSCGDAVEEPPAGATAARLLGGVRDGLHSAAAWLRQGAAATHVADPARPAAPPLLGVTATDERFDLAAMRGAPVVLLFYRGHACGMCLHRLEAFNAHHDRYRALGARLAAVSADPPGSVRRTADQLGLAFPVASVGHDVLEAWNVWLPGEDAPRPAAAIIDADGRLAFIRVGANAADRVVDAELLAELRRVAAPVPDR